MELCDKRRSLKATKHKSSNHAEEYRIVHNLIRRSLKDKKDEWLKSQCNQIDYELKRGVHSNRTYNTIKAITNPTNRKISNIEDANGISLEDDNAKLDRWTEYCKDLYNYPIKTDRAKVETYNIREDDEQPLPILKSEMIHAIKSLNNDKSPGIENVPSELLKGGCEALNDIITKLCQKVWSTNQWPYLWSTSLIITIPKKRYHNIFKISYYKSYQPYKQHSPVNYIEQINSISRRYSSGRISRF